MKKIQKILAPTDMSELSCVGVRYALEMARELSAEVIVHHVVPMGEDWFTRQDKHGPVRNLLANEEAALDKFLAEKFADDIKLVKVYQKVEFGGPHTSIVEMTGLSHMLLGSVTEKVVARAPCPVLVIPSHKRPTAATRAD
jgi:nucleotide-binding universal stress UspA family protein